MNLSHLYGTYIEYLTTAIQSFTLLNYYFILGRPGYGCTSLIVIIIGPTY